jgi:hypothetical protein
MSIFAGMEANLVGKIMTAVCSLVLKFSFFLKDK